MTFPANPIPQLVPQRMRHQLSRLAPLRWTDERTLAVQGGPINAAPVDLKTARGQRFVKVQSGEYFGPAGGGWQQRWFRLEVPAARADEKGRRALHWRCDGEATVWIDGKPWAGLDVAHGYCVLPDGAKELYLDCGTYMTGIWLNGAKVPEHGCQFNQASVALRDELAWNAYYDWEALVQLMDRLIGANDIEIAPRFGYNAPVTRAPVLLRRLLHLGDQACDAFDGKGLAAFAKAVRGIYKELRASDHDGVAALCGHAHLDLVWLWPEVETNRKGVHTFSTVMRLMERYPEFRFTQSQPAIYDAVGALAPSLLREIKTRIKQKKWEATGALEVESDVTLPSGEGLARAFLYGQQRFKDLRGSYSSTLWIPDVFGYSNCLPQLCSLAGVDYFYTTKLTWSAVSKFPYSSFHWRSPNGSSVLTHLCPIGYNGNITAAEIADPVLDNVQAGVHDEVLLPSGYGDGAGGPTEDMIERSRRFADLAGMPKAKWTRVEDFFDRLAEHADELPSYEGELYLEYHRGTYTTQGLLKFLYRQAEKVLLAHEAARVLAGKGPLPADHWLRTLFVQFHDAIPGSSIGLVYEQLNPELAAIAERERTAAAKLLAGRGRQLGVFNPVAQQRRAVVPVPAELAKSGIVTAAGEPVPVQRAAGRGAGHVALVDLPGLTSMQLLPASSKSKIGNDLVVTTQRLGNGRVDARFDKRGQLQSLRIDGRDSGLRQSQFRLYDDHPANFDAWDIDRGSLALAVPVATECPLRVVERGPVRAVLQGESSLGDGSRLLIRYSLTAGSDLLDVHCTIDWAEEHKLLKWHAVTDWRGRMARYGAPFGAVERQQVPGDQSIEAQWEVAGQRWAAVGDDADQGLALVTEAKYGFSCLDGDLGLSLLRAPTHPDPDADRHRHDIRFALGAYRRTSSEGCLSTAAEAEARFAETPVLSGMKAFAAPFTVDELGGVVVAAVKPAENGKGYIIRLHETAGQSGSCALRFVQAPKRIEAVDILERKKPRRLDRRGSMCRVAYRPYEIISLHVQG